MGLLYDFYFYIFVRIDYGKNDVEEVIIYYSFFYIA